jgi:hypothetical protein
MSPGACERMKVASVPAAFRADLGEACELACLHFGTVTCKAEQGSIAAGCACELWSVQ